MSSNILDVKGEILTGITLRHAVPDDADVVVDILRALVFDLCFADHNNVSELITFRLANKTTSNVRTWIEGAGFSVITEEQGRPVGVGMVTPSGEITLNYVTPDARFRGVSKAILAALKNHLHQEGGSRVTLSSTQTAHSFYVAAGYVDKGEPKSWGGLKLFPMVKASRSEQALSVNRR